MDRILNTLSEAIGILLRDTLSEARSGQWVRVQHDRGFAFDITIRYQKL